MSPIIDARGKACPTPVIMAKKAISAGESTFTVLVDNTTAVENLKRLAENQGFDAAVTEQGGAFHLAFVRTGCAACEEAVNAPLPAPGGDWAVFVGRDIIGTNCNTLIFAFVGGALMTILVLFSYGVQPNQLISSDYVALELAQGLCGTCAVILTVPLASLAAAACFGKQKVPGLSGLHTAKNGKK